MLHTNRLLGVALALLVPSGCRSYTVSAHVVDVVVDEEGTVTRGVLAFPDQDDEVVGGDSSCSLFSGNCGELTSARATIYGDTRIREAKMTGGTSRRYDLSIEPLPGDPPPPPEWPAAAAKDPWIRCRIYHFTDGAVASGFGEPTGCWGGTARAVKVTLSFRDGDDGR